MSKTSGLYETYQKKMHRIADVKFASAVLQWDQETYLPPKGARFRGQQIGTLSEINHRFFSEEELGSLLKDLLQANDLTPEQHRNVEVTFDDYVRNKKFTTEFVRKLSDQTQKAFHSWINSRKENSFPIYEKDLDELIKLKRQEAELLGYKCHPYNALLDEFEKGTTVELLDKSFNDVLPALKDILDSISVKKQVDDSFLKLKYPKQQQWDWGMQLIKDLNFDFEAGRQDISEHPFSTSFNSCDVRITTRIDETDFSNMTWSCIHETGHALYEQGLKTEFYGLPLAEACSYSIHESQSRLWENNVGRSLHFWAHYFPILKNHFPEQLKNIDLSSFYKGINKVQPSLIRTEADEISYHFHVFIRYDLEKKLIEGTINAHDIPAFWNEQYKKLLNVIVPDDKKGCLQDVHWSHGSFGYFPTYSLGSFYAAQFYNKAKEQIPFLEEQIEKGDTGKLLEWLREKIHIKGKFFISEDLCRDVCGEPLNVKYFVNYLLLKYKAIYNL
ncbi:MAG: carboxypeptidase M32 [Flavisolibacter sp.]